MMEKIDEFKELRSLMTNQPFDEGLKSYKDRLYPGNKVGEQKGIDQYFYYILDWQTRSYPYISSNWKEIIDYDGNFWKMGFDAVLNIVHPEDTRALQCIVKKWIEFVKAKGSEASINDHSVSFDFRLVKKNGEEIHVLQQNLHTCLDKKGNIIYDLGMFTDISHLKNDSDPTLRIMDPNGKKILEYHPKTNSVLSLAFENKISANGNTFIDRLQNIINDHFYDTGFGIRELSHKMNLSRYQLHRKTKSLIDLPPNAMIRVMRLKKAVKLLEENNLSISEIAYQVGFSSPTYFSKCFNEEFGFSPRSYRKKVHKSH